VTHEIVGPKTKANPSQALDDIARVTFYVRSKGEQRPLIDEEWNAMFSSSAVQPARLVIEVIPQAAPPLSVQCEFIALIGGGRI
jgi:enamine deaminase RidA (YjgF/YER057c/UK114 family)